MELFAHFIMFNAVSRSIACVSVPQSNHKYPYAIDFKMACLIVRKYYKLYNEKPPNMMFAEILAYTVPVRAGRSVDILPTAKAGGFLHQSPLRSNRSCCVLHDVRQALLPVCPTVRYVLV